MRAFLCARRGWGFGPAPIFLHGILRYQLLSIRYMKDMSMTDRKKTIRGLADALGLSTEAVSFKGKDTTPIPMEKLPFSKTLDVDGKEICIQFTKTDAPAGKLARGVAFLLVTSCGMPARGRFPIKGKNIMLPPASVFQNIEDMAAESLAETPFTAAQKLALSTGDLETYEELEGRVLGVVMGGAGESLSDNMPDIMRESLREQAKKVGYKGSDLDEAVERASARLRAVMQAIDKDAVLDASGVVDVDLEGAFDLGFKSINNGADEEDIGRLVVEHQNEITERGFSCLTRHYGQWGKAVQSTLREATGMGWIMMRNWPNKKCGGGNCDLDHPRFELGRLREGVCLLLGSLLWRLGLWLTATADGPERRDDGTGRFRMLMGAINADIIGQDGIDRIHMGNMASEVRDMSVRAGQPVIVSFSPEGMGHAGVQWDELVADGGTIASKIIKAESDKIEAFKRAERVRDGQDEQDAPAASFDRDFDLGTWDGQNGGAA